jgi:hypothetical protein
MNHILDHTVLAELEQAAPKVVTSSWENHRAMVAALAQFASTHKTQVDLQGQAYWQSDYPTLIMLSGIALTTKQAGNICARFYLPVKHENDGNKVAWSEKQLSILKQAFGM